MHLNEKKTNQKTVGKSRKEVNEQFKQSIFYNNDDSDCIGVLWPLIEILIPRRDNDDSDEE